MSFLDKMPFRIISVGEQFTCDENAEIIKCIVPVESSTISHVNIKPVGILKN